MNNETIIYQMEADSNKGYKTKALVSLLILVLCFIINTIISLAVGSFLDQFESILQGYIVGYIFGLIALIFFIYYFIMYKKGASGTIILTNKRIYCHQIRRNYEKSIYLNHIVSIEWIDKRIYIISVGPIMHFSYDKKMYESLISIL